jgi:hypothetical protein
MSGLEIASPLKKPNIHTRLSFEHGNTCLTGGVHIQKRCSIPNVYTYLELFNYYHLANGLSVFMFLAMEARLLAPQYRLTGCFLMRVKLLVLSVNPTWIVSTNIIVQADMHEESCVLFR